MKKLFLFLLIIGIVLFAGCTQPNNKDTNNEAIYGSVNNVINDSNNLEENTNQVVGTVEGTISSSNAHAILLDNHNTYSAYSYNYVIGEVKNDGDANLNYVKIIATFYDSDGNIVDTDFSYSKLDILKPGEKSPFEISTTNSFSTYKLQLDYSKTSEEPYRNFEILSHSTSEKYGYLNVIGEVKNIGDKEKDHIKIIGTFYDNTGKVVATDYSYTKIDKLKPGDTSPFELSINQNYLSSPIDNYLLIVDA